MRVRPGMAPGWLFGAPWGGMATNIAGVVLPDEIADFGILGDGARDGAGVALGDVAVEDISSESKGCTLLVRGPAVAECPYGLGDFELKDSLVGVLVSGQGGDVSLVAHTLVDTGVAARSSLSTEQRELDKFLREGSRDSSWPCSCAVRWE